MCFISRLWRKRNSIIFISPHEGEIEARVVNWLFITTHRIEDWASSQAPSILICNNSICLSAHILFLWIVTNAIKIKILKYLTCKNCSQIFIFLNSVANVWAFSVCAFFMNILAQEFVGRQVAVGNSLILMFNFKELLHKLNIWYALSFDFTYTLSQFVRLLCLHSK